ncbi:MAG: stage II sporulation protein M [Fimbriimonadales bacterium]
MTREEFIRRREPSWRELEGLLKRGSLQQLQGHELLKMGSLYRRLTSDLAYARQRYADPELAEYLNRLAQRGYAKVHVSRTGGTKLFPFLAHTFPLVLRRNWKLFLLATAIFYLPGVFAYFHVLSNPDSTEIFMNRDFFVAVQDRIEAKTAAPLVTDELTSQVSAEVMTNNVRVSMMCYAGGAAGGILTLFVLFYNGLMLGSFAGLFHHADLGYLMWTSILPHGVSELTAICLAGAAGLRLAAGALLPGRMRRGDSFVKGAKESVVILGGSIVLLFVAGIIEGFISFTDAPDALKWSVTITTAILCFLYLVVLPMRVREKGPT